MTTLTQWTPAVEVYSIDEAFVDLTGISTHNLTGYGQTLRATIHQWIGIPVSIGIAPRKLAKLANRLAKRSPQGVVALTITAEIDATRALGSKTSGVSAQDILGASRPTTSDRVTATGCERPVDTPATRRSRAAHRLGTPRHLVLAAGTVSIVQTKSDGVTILWPSHHSTDRDARGGSDVYHPCS